MTPEDPQPPAYAGVDRRKYPKTMEQFELDVRKMFEAHEQHERKWISDLRDELLKAFPNGDIEGHCDYHISKIRAARAEEEFWKTAKSEAVKHGVAGLFATLKWVSILAVVGLAYKLGVGPAVAKVVGIGG